MYNLRVQPWLIATRTFESGRNMEVLKFIATLPNGDKQVEVANPTAGYKYYVLKEDLPKDEKRPWYQVLGQGTFRGVGLGLEFSKLPKAIQWIIIIALGLAVRYIFKKAKR